MRPTRPTIQAAHLPAPLGGINTVAPASAMPPEDCAYAWNVLPGELGLRVRHGYREWCTGLAGGSDSLVRTIIPFAGSARNGTGDRLFATTSTGIWDVTARGASPPQVLAFSVQSGDSGRGVAQAVVTAGGHFLVYCDEANGLHVYSESSGLWAEVQQGGGAGQVSGVDPRRLVHAAVWKNRLWLTERDSSRAWYLAAGSIFGALTSFDFGRQFRSGGGLVGLWNWTYDGGAGLDDGLVALGGAGDVVVYQGTDPASINTFALKGVWHVGGLPFGRRIATDFGGDLLVLSRMGLVPLSRLVVGASAADRSLYATAKIANLFSSLMARFGDLPGWSVHAHPTDNALMVTIPAAPGRATEQLVMSFTSRSWWRYRGLPLVSAGVWSGELYMGTADGRVCRHAGWLDDGEPVAWSVLTAYQNLGKPVHKQVQSLRPTLLSGTPEAAVRSSARYDYQLLEPPHPSGVGGGGSSAWGSALWGAATWGGSQTVTRPVQGAAGMGRDVAVAVAGNAISRTTLVGVDIMFTVGGPL